MTQENVKSKYKIGYLLPYFGSLPENTKLWLLSCKKNPTVDWVLLTDDKTEYDYPENVKVHYCTYEEIKERIQNHFDFPIVINKPWKLCEYRPAYGQIFAEELKGYDFWGHCDMDLIWGDIRKFITDDILDRYDKIGFQGHSTIYRNTDEVNSIYLNEIEGLTSYKEAFTTDEGLCFDEVGISDIYKAIGKEYYQQTNFAHLSLMNKSFHLGHLPKEDEYKNHRQVIVWNDGKLFRYYNHKGKMHTQDEFMYLHFFMRPVTYKIDDYDENNTYVTYPDVVKNIDLEDIDYQFIQKNGKCSYLKFYSRLIYKNRHKITVKKVNEKIKNKYFPSKKKKAKSKSAGTKANTSSVLSKFIQLIIAALLGKGLGFIREMVLAYFYGTSAVSDVFVASQSIPNVIFSIFGVAITTGFIPLFTDIKIHKGEKQAKKFTNNVFNIFMVISLIISVVGIFFSKILVNVFAGGFTGSTYEMCDNFAKIVIPTGIAILGVYVYNAYLQIEGHFNQNSLMNVPYNLTQIIFIIIGFYLGNVYLLAVGLLLSCFAQFVYLRILMKTRTDFKHEAVLNIKDQHIKEMLILVGPIFISSSINQVNSIVDKALGSRLIEGSVAALNYSNEVSNIITQVFILSLTTILYPKMTELFAKNAKERFGFTEKYLNVVSVMVLPMVGLMFFFSKEIVQILFGRGAFDDNTVIFVSRALKLYALGIAGASYRDAFNKLFYSMKNTVIPMINGVIAVLANIGLNFLLIKRFEYLGLAFATSFASTLCTVLLFIRFIGKMKGINVKLILIEFLKALIATGALVGVCYGLDYIIPITNDYLRCIVFAPIALLGYLLVLIIFKEPIQKELFQKLKTKLKK